MKKIIVGLFVSLDGVIQGPGPSDEYEYAGWTMPYSSDDVMGVIGGTMMRCDCLLLGRKTYQGFEATFSSEGDDLSKALTAVPKYLVSTTIKQPTWKNTTVISGNVAEEIAKLKQQPGTDISVSGSASVVHYLMQHDLVDEYSLMVYPVVLGTGTRLSPDGVKSTLKLLSSRALDKGVQHLSYEVEHKA